MPENWKNKLYYGDNLFILRNHIEDESVDLIYLDPPFNSNASYNVLFRESDGKSSDAQITAFEDTWHWDTATELAYMEVIQNPPRKLADLLQALHMFLGRNDMMAYLTMMAIRLVELRRVLKPTGSIYLHCDPTASHYIKLLMDAVFGPECFQNEIVWRRSGSHNKLKRYGPIHDIIFFYTKSEEFQWLSPIKPYMKKHVETFFKKENDEYKTAYYGNVLTGSGVRSGESGLPWKGIDPTSKNRHWAIPKGLLTEIEEDLSKYSVHQKLDKLFELGLIKIIPGSAWPSYEHKLKPTDGYPLPDIWAYQPYTEGTVFDSDKCIDQDVKWLTPKDKERLGYPTQKPEGLLARIIKASSKEGDIVLDPFCGCGTTVNVAERLHRKWIGIDITHLSINLMKRRLKNTFNDNLLPYIVIGEPQDVSGARELFHQDPFQFEWWSVGMIDAVPINDKRKGSDRGIDGYIYFIDDDSGLAKKVIVQVKGGKIDVKYIRDLVGTLQREKAQIGALVCLDKPTSHMEREAKDAGMYESPNGRLYPKIQILTIEEIFEGRKIDYPFRDTGGFSTYKKAQKKDKEKGPEKNLFNK